MVKSRIREFKIDKNKIINQQSFHGFEGARQTRLSTFERPRDPTVVRRRRRARVDRPSRSAITALQVSAMADEMTWLTMTEVGRCRRSISGYPRVGQEEKPVFRPISGMRDDGSLSAIIALVEAELFGLGHERQ